MPFDPIDADPPDIGLALEDRDVGGLGIHLVLNLVDEISYQRLDEKNVITFEKKLAVENPPSD